MKYLKVTCYFAFVAALINISACSNGEIKRYHRLQWWLEAINWDIENRTSGLSGKGVLIAVIDTATDECHPDLVGKIIERHVVEGAPEDLQYEHGTAVAGIICASPSNKDGVLGVAVDAKILSIVISNNTEARMDSLINGIEYAITRGANIINISAGVINNDCRLQAVIEDACSAGIVVVAASGNDLHGMTLYPAKYKNVISVGSIDPSGEKLYGENSGSVFLPGGNIVTAYSSRYEPKKYVSYSGTSMSAPILTGVIALVLEQNPAISNNDIVAYFRGFEGNKFDTMKILSEFGKGK